MNKNLCRLLLIIAFHTVVYSVLPAATILHKTSMVDLSNNAIICMHQDPDGYLWIGTYDGLNLYNGKDTYVYRFEMNNKNSLCSNIIHHISDAEPGYLWISTSLGINKFSLEQRKVTESYPGYMECDLLATDSEGNTLQVSRDNYLSCYTLQSDGFRDLPRGGINKESVRALFCTGPKRFEMLLASGVLKKLTAEFSTTAFNVSSEEQVIHDKGILSAFYEDSILYMVDEAEKLYAYPMDGRAKSLVHDLSGLISKYGGLSSIKRFRSHFFLVFRSGVILNLSRPGHVEDIGIGVFCVMRDKRQDILWVGTDGQGLRMFYDKPDLFGSILLKDLPVNVQNPIRSVYTDSDHSLWFGTKGDGIVRLRNYDSYIDRPIQPADLIRYTTNNGLSSNRVYCFAKSPHHPFVWIGTEGPGLSFYSVNDDRIRLLPAPSQYPVVRMVHDICEVNDSTLWIATTGDGLLEVSFGLSDGQPEIRSTRSYPLKNGENTCKEIQTMIYDGDSTLFLGSRGGYGMITFNIYDKSYEFIQTNNIANPAIGDVLSLCQGPDSTFYLGASSGLTFVRFADGKPFDIRHFDKNSGIANDMIHGINRAADSCIWFSTNKGLTKYNPHNHFFHNYHRPNLNVTEFSDDAYWKCPYTDRLFFGGINGLAWVNKHVESMSAYQPDLHFFEMQTDNETVSLYGYEKNDATKRPELVIPASTQAFTISFVAPDYINGENYEYAYMLEEYQSEWVELQKNNKVSFSNIPSGRYVLKVRYRNDVIDSDTKVYSLPLRVLPPVYLTTWAIMGYFVLGLALCFFVVYRVHRQIARRQQQMSDKIREEQKEKLYESKLNFFTHITHELCTPLTLITGVENYIRAYAHSASDKTLERYSSVLKENVDELNGLIQEILDFRKAEDNGFNDSHIRSISVSGLLRTQFELFFPLSDQKRIQFNISSPEEDLYWNTDPVYLKKIMANLISNAFKYTRVNGGRVDVNLSASDDHLTLRVYNTGEGIKEADRQVLFDRFRILGMMDNESDRENTSRNGLGLYICYSLVCSLGGDIQVKSEVGEYAEFIVTLPWLEAETPAAAQPSTLRQDKEEEEVVEATPSVLPAATEADPEEKPLILVIDDHKDIVWLISEALSDAYSVKGAYSAEEALEFLEIHTPSLIITDIMMPSMNGLELVARIRENKYTRHIPLIIVSAKISDKEQSAGLDIGANAYLTKPFSPLVLQSVVSRLMASQRELKDYFYSPESAYKLSEGQLMHQEDKEFMDSVMAVIKDNIGKEGLGPDMIATELNLNTRSLYRRFKKISSLTPSDFIKDYRLSYAAQLLINTNLSVQEIVYSVGISNKSYFYREFARKYEMTPKEYRLKG